MEEEQETKFVITIIGKALQHTIVDGGFDQNVISESGSEENIGGPCKPHDNQTFHVDLVVNSMALETTAYCTLLGRPWLLYIRMGCTLLETNGMILYMDLNWKTMSEESVLFSSEFDNDEDDGGYKENENLQICMEFQKLKVVTKKDLFAMLSTKVSSTNWPDTQTIHSWSIATEDQMKANFVTKYYVYACNQMWFVPCIACISTIMMQAEAWYGRYHGLSFCPLAKTPLFSAYPSVRRQNPVLCSLHTSSSTPVFCLSVPAISHRCSSLCSFLFADLLVCSHGCPDLFLSVSSSLSTQNRQTPARLTCSLSLLSPALCQILVCRFSKLTAGTSFLQNCLVPLHQIVMHLFYKLSRGKKEVFLDDWSIYRLTSTCELTVGVELVGGQEGEDLAFVQSNLHLLSWAMPKISLDHVRCGIMMQMEMISLEILEWDDDIQHFKSGSGNDIRPSYARYLEVGSYSVDDYHWLDYDKDFDYISLDYDE
eukprot:Gb_22809 [translate_table: standard]